MDRLWYGQMVKALTCRVEGPRFESDHGKRFRKKFRLKVSKKRKRKKTPAILCLHDGSPNDGCAPQLVKKAGVCAIMSI